MFTRTTALFFVTLSFAFCSTSTFGDEVTEPQERPQLAEQQEAAVEQETTEEQQTDEQQKAAKREEAEQKLVDMGVRLTKGLSYETIEKIKGKGSWYLYLAMRAGFKLGLIREKGENDKTYELTIGKRPNLESLDEETKAQFPILPEAELLFRLSEIELLPVSTVVFERTPTVDEIFALKYFQKLHTLEFERDLVWRDNWLDLATLRKIRKLILNSDVSQGPKEDVTKARDDRHYALEAVSSIDSLEHLELQGNFGKTGFSCLSKLSNLRSLAISASLDYESFSFLGATGARGIPQFLKLEKLNIFGADIDDESLSHLRKLRNLRKLALGRMPNVTGAGFSYLRDLDKLVELEIGWGLPLTDEGLSYLGCLDSLSKLYLHLHSDRGAVITDRGAIYLSEMQSLKQLSLSDLDIGDKGLRALAKLPNLKYLDLGETRITDEGLKALSGHSTLENLDIHGNPGITNEGLAELEALPALETLTAAGTSIDLYGLQHLARHPAINFVQIAATKNFDADSSLDLPSGFENLEYIGVFAPYPEEASEEEIRLITEALPTISVKGY